LPRTIATVEHYVFGTIRMVFASAYRLYTQIIVVVIKHLCSATSYLNHRRSRPGSVTNRSVISGACGTYQMILEDCSR